MGALVLPLPARSHKLAGGSVSAMREPCHLMCLMMKERCVRSLPGVWMLGFAIPCDRSEWLMEHYRQLQQREAGKQLLDAWSDFGGDQQPVQVNRGLA